MKYIQLTSLVFSLVVLLSACGSSTVTDMSGEWAADLGNPTIKTELVLDMTDSSNDLSGSMKARVQGTSSSIGNFTGKRSGNSVTLNFGAATLNGNLSGSKLTFQELSGLYSATDVVFVKQ